MASKSKGASSLKNPAPNFRFFVEKSGQTVAAFLECSGLTAKRKVEPYYEGGVNDIVHMLPGPMEYENIVLKRGITNSQELWDWFWAGAHDFHVERANISIILVDVDGTAVERWDVLNAYPIKWQGPDLKSAGNEVAVETIEIAHEGLRISSA